MGKLECLDKNYSTTRLCYKLLDGGYLDSESKVREDVKFSINIPELGIKDSKIPKLGEEKFDTYLFLPEGEGRQGEGGLRTKGYFKFSYEIENGRWYACNFRGERLFEVEPPKEFDIDIDKFRSEDGITKLPLITIITVVLNRKEGLRKTIESVINQTYPNVEYIVIDGGSTDGTLDLMREYEDYIDYWVSEKDRGIYDAMNKGIMVSQGTWLNFLNSGDYILVEDIILNDIAHLFINNRHKVWLFNCVTKHKWIRANRLIASPFAKYTMYKLPTYHQAIFYSRYCFAVEMYSNKYKLVSDYLHFYNLVVKYGIRIGFKDLNYCYYDTEGLTSKDKFSLYREFKDLESSIFISAVRNFVHNIYRPCIHKRLKVLT